MDLSDDQQMTDLIRKCLGDFRCKPPDQPPEQSLPPNGPFGTNHRKPEQSNPNLDATLSASQQSTEKTRLQKESLGKGVKRDNEDESQSEEENSDHDDDHNSQRKTRRQVVWGVSGGTRNGCHAMINKKSNLLRLACDQYAGHKWNSFLQLAHGLILNTRLPGYLLMKNFLLFLHHKSPISPEDLAVASHFIHDVLFMMEERFETLNELALFLIDNQHLMSNGKIFLNDLVAKVERVGKIGLARRIRENNRPKSFVVLRTAFDINKELIDYHEWKQNHSNMVEDYSSSRMDSIKISKMISNFRRILNDAELEELSMDIVALILMELYDYECDLLETKNMFEEYSHKFTDNLNGHVYLYEFLCKYRDIEYDPMLKINALKHIVRLCPDSKYLLHLIKHPPKVTGLNDPLQCVEMLCNFLDYESNQHSHKAWKCLYQTMKTIDQEDGQSKLRSYFQWKLYYWQRMHFDLDQLQQHLPEFHRRYNRWHSGKHRSDSDFSFGQSSSEESDKDDDWKVTNDQQQQQQQHPRSKIQNRRLFQTILCKAKFLKQLEQNACLQEHPKLVQYKNCVFNV